MESDCPWEVRMRVCVCSGVEDSELVFKLCAPGAAVSGLEQEKKHGALRPQKP